MLKKLAERVECGKGIQMDVDEELKAKVAEEGYDPSYGARPLKRAIMRLVEDTLAEAILDGKVENGGCITLFPDGRYEVDHKRPLRLDNDEEEDVVVSESPPQKKTKEIGDPNKQDEIPERLLESSDS
ncbi:unnamed protein product [Linum trigynum]|uniref:Clp ATPase C-terminal domain-containing protein n=1 Tax=Linum trigynum TaxID=586398 RepID=A0AAV2GCJ8_9ROSI